MATPLTADQLVAALRAEGLDVVEMPGWRGRCRCHDGSHEQGIAPNGRGWGEINGVTIHITTGGQNSGQAAVEYAAGILTRGKPGVPGPLVQTSIAADGKVLLIAVGRSNHVGEIGQAALNTMIAASFSTTGYQDVRGNGVDGNTHTYGVEIQTPVTPNDAQRAAAVKLAAAICRAYGWTGQEVHGHGEVSDQRSYSDPNMDMGAFRRDVMAQVVGTSGGGAAGGLPTGTVPVPQAPSPVPVLVLEQIVRATTLDASPGSPTGRVHYGDPVGSKVLEQALLDVGLNPGPVDGSLGTSFQRAYASWQRALGYTGKDADGIPGRASLTALGRRTGRFTVA